MVGLVFGPLGRYAVRRVGLDRSQEEEPVPTQSLLMEARIVPENTSKQKAVNWLPVQVSMLCLALFHFYKAFFFVSRVNKYIYIFSFNKALAIC